MGSNFHTPWAASVTSFTAAAMNPALASLDQGLTYLKNVLVHCDGVITYNKTTGAISWSGTIRITFNTAAGLAVQNTIAAGSITLADAEFFYVDLSETDAAAVTASKAAVTTGAASNFIAFNRLVLAYRNSGSDNVYPVHLHPQLNDPAKLVQSLTCADNVTIDWSKGWTADITLDRATTTFAFSGATDGARLVLRIKQYAGPGAVAFGAEVRAGTELSSPPDLTATADLTDILGYIYNGTATKYDFVSMIKGF
ncbi:MAG: hypothetical protein M0R06_01500 [Sphaerochaeta sp.]|jgi:hypothetical protein|nr:hypothetical protein [Sphaerochaeta sp.]